MTTKSSTEEDDNEEITSVKFDVIGHLPIEIAQKILFKLSPEDLHSVTSCCLSWRAALANDFFWERLCQRESYFEVEERKRSEFCTSFFKKYNYWQAVYWYNHTLLRNWETNNYRMITYTLKRLDEYKYRYFFDGVFARESSDHKILYVYNMKNKKLKPFVFSMRDHNNDHGSNIITQNGKYLIHLVARSSLTVWNFEEGITVLDESWNHVTDVYFYKDLIVLKTWEKMFEVYNIKTSKIEYDWTEIIKNVNIMDGTIVFTAKDYVIHILKWHDKSRVTLKCCGEKYHNKLLVKNEFLLSLCSSNEDFELSLCVWNITTRTKLHTVLTRQWSNYLDCALFMNKYLYSRVDLSFNFDYCIDLWNYMKSISVQALLSGINKHLSSDGRLSNDHFMFASHAYKFNLWCLRKNYFICELNNFDGNTYQDNKNVLVTSTKLIYVLEKHDIFLNIRDYEI